MSQQTTCESGLDLHVVFGALYIVLPVMICEVYLGWNLYSYISNISCRKNVELRTSRIHNCARSYSTF